MSNKMYIYNPLQAKFFINEGVKCIDTGIHWKTKCPFWVFNYYECSEAHKKWVGRKHE